LQLHIVEVSAVPAGNQAFPKKAIDVQYPADAPTDFPVSMQVGTKMLIKLNKTVTGSFRLHRNKD